MGMSSHVIGFRPPDDKFKKMKDAYDACEKAGVDPPAEVTEFFDNLPPDPRGVEVTIEATEWSCDSQSGYEIDISKLPKSVTIIRFYNSW